MERARLIWAAALPVEGTRASHLDATLPADAITLAVQDGVFQQGDIVTVFYPFPFTIRAARKEVVTLTVVSVPPHASTAPGDPTLPTPPNASGAGQPLPLPSTWQVNVSPFDTDATGLPTGSRVQKQEPLFESARISRLSAPAAPNSSRVGAITLAPDNIMGDNQLVGSLQPGDTLLVHRPIVTLDVEPYQAEGNPALVTRRS